MRALAVMLVVADHLGLEALAGGFIGVDVFFVISGFLITSLLADEFRRSQADGSAGRISLKGFYIRRARRILPASLLVIAAVLVAAKLAWGPLRFQSVQSDAMWATVFMSNFGLMRHATNYFASGIVVSPLQNYWSLAVEEQFYIVWPLMFMAAARLGWRTRGKVRRSWRGQATAAILALTGASLAWSAFLTASDPHRAYFSPFTRAWELGVGALAAMAAPWLAGSLKGRAASVAGLLGTALIATSIAVVGRSTAYPGLIALLPVLGAACLIVAGLAPTSRNPAGAVLSVAPIRFIGRISFSIYLWHWPIIVFAQSQNRATGKMHLSHPLAVLALIMVVSWLSYRLVEQPFRTIGKGAGGPLAFFRTPRSRPAWLALAGMSAVTVATVVTIALWARPDSTWIAASQSTRELAIRPSDVVSDGPSTERIRELEQGLAVKSRTSAQMRAIGQTLHSSDSMYFCTEQARALAPAEPACDIPTRGGGIGLEALNGRRVLLLGNSYAAQWARSIASLLPASSRFTNLTVAGCSPLELGGAANHVSVDQVNCPAWADWELAQASRLRPSLVVVASRSDTNPTQGAARGLAEFLSRVRQTGARLLWISSLPLAPNWSICANSANDITNCSLTAQEAQRPIDRFIQSAVEAEGAHYWDLKPLFCTAAGCPALLKGKAVRQEDGAHLNAWAMVDAEPQLNAAMIAALRPEGSRAIARTGKGSR